MMQVLKAVFFLGAFATAGALTAARLFQRTPKISADAPALEERRAHPIGASKKQVWLRIGALLVLLAIGGFLGVVSGLVPIKASSGHWPITAWFLHFAMRRSVNTHSLGVQAPPLDDPAMVLQGAGHYETGCRPCHGSPDMPNPRIPQHMTPHPPYLPTSVPAWEPRELFYIVKHGVKFTGMPAWPALQRDDEVWAMVAFLQTLPGLDASGYQRLVYGENTTSDGHALIQDMLPPEKVPQAIHESCGRCHGVDGRGRGTGAFPRLAGQRLDYLYAALEAYARGTRHSGVMSPIAAALSPTDMRELALYYAKQEISALAASASPSANTAAIARGKTIASEGIPGQRVPSCVDCHGPGATRRNLVYPNLAGQYASYLVLQLELFKKGNRGGSAYAHLMHPVAAQLRPAQMRDVALYYESLPSNLKRSTP